MFWGRLSALKTLWMRHVQYLTPHCPGPQALCFTLAGAHCASPPHSLPFKNIVALPVPSSISPSIHFFPLCNIEKQLIGALCCKFTMKRGGVVEDSEWEKWWHQRGGRLEMLVEISSVRAEGSNRTWKEKCITQHGTHGQDTNSPLQGWETTLKTTGSS